MVAHAGKGWQLARSLIALEREANQLAPQRRKSSDGSIGDLAHAARTSDHNIDGGYCHAIDLTHDPAGGFDAHAHARRTATNNDSRIKYVISNRQIWQPGRGWRAYTGANGHTQHAHWSVWHNSTGRDNVSPWLNTHRPEQPAPGPGPTPPPTIGKTQMFAIIRYSNGQCFRWNGINRCPIPNPKMLGGDQIMLAALGMSSKVYDVDEEWGNTYPEVSDNKIYWNTRLSAEKLGVSPLA